MSQARVGARGRVLAVLALAYGTQASGAGPATAGVLVERLVPGGAAERAGVRPGDILLRWSRAAQQPANPEPAHGALQSPFDVEAVEIEQAPRGPLTLEGLRQGDILTLQMPAGEWLVTLRPVLDAEALESYERGRERVQAGALAEGTAVWLTLAEGRLADAPLAAWLLSRSLGTWTDAAEWPAASCGPARTPCSGRSGRSPTNRRNS